MTIVKARLIAHAPEDGLVEFRDDVPLGTQYDVVLETRRVADLFNSDRQRIHSKELISTPCGCWLPMECLRLQVH